MKPSIGWRLRHGDGYLPAAAFAELNAVKLEVGRMVGGMILHPRPFLLRQKSSA